MIDPGMQAKAEQSSAFMAEMFPPLWRAVFMRLLDAGFSEQQSMDILKTYILACFSVSGINAPKS